MRVTRTKLQLGAVYGAIVIVSVLHYTAPVHAYSLHDIYRRLYYLPIILAAFQGGWRGGLVAATVVCIAYAPHAFGHISHDPATPTQKLLEMLLYYAVGLTTGTLVSRLHRAQRDLRLSLDQLRSTEVELVQAARLAAVGRLSAGLAHEIRNPLASIKGSAELLADDFPAPHAKRRLLQALVDESVRLNNTLTRFLSFARPAPLNRQPIRVKSEIDAVITLLRTDERARAVRISASYGDALISISGDHEQIRQVFLNILLNAAQAAGPNGTVRVECEESDAVIALRVRDSGGGFPTEALENAFTPFFTTKTDGTGLGLAISHRIVESHGGRIRISNHPEGGGLVEIEFPTGGADG